MDRIFKYQLDLVNGPQPVMLPDESTLLTAQMQNGNICVWARVNPDSPSRMFFFFVVGTGHPMPEGASQYLATVQMGPFVWHVFWRTGA